MVTISPEFIRISNWALVGRAVFEPVPDACREITPAVDEGLPKVLALLTIDDELVVEKEEVVVGDERIVEEAGETVAAPEEEKVKV